MLEYKLFKSNSLNAITDGDICHIWIVIHYCRGNDIMIQSMAYDTPGITFMGCRYWHV